MSENRTAQNSMEYAHEFGQLKKSLANEVAHETEQIQLYSCFLLKSPTILINLKSIK